MAHGLRIWDSSGNLKLDVNDLLPRYVGTLSGVSKAADVIQGRYNVALDEFVYAKACVTNTFYIPYSGVSNDGTWDAVITNIGGLAPNQSMYPPDYLSACCTFSPNLVTLTVETLLTFFGDPPYDANWNYIFQSLCDYNIELYRVGG